MKKMKSIQKLLQIRELTLLVIILLSCVVLSIVSPYFLTRSNALIVLNGMALEMIVACGVTISLIGGNIDFSVGSILGCAAFTTARCMAADFGRWDAYSMASSGEAARVAIFSVLSDVLWRKSVFAFSHFFLTR